MLKMNWWITCFFFKQHFYKQRQAEIAKKKYQVNAKQHPEAELLLFENYSHSSFTLSFKNNRTYSKNYPNEKGRLCSWDYAINHKENGDENKKQITMMRH